MVTGHITSLEIVLSHTHIVPITPEKRTPGHKHCVSTVSGLEGLHCIVSTTTWTYSIDYKFWVQTVLWYKDFKLLN